MPIVNESEWKGFLDKRPQAHLLQSVEWGNLKADFGWEPVRFVHGETGGQVLFRKLPLGLTLAYMPKGLVGPEWESLLDEIEEFCQERRAVFLKIEPDMWEGEGERTAELQRRGYRPSKHDIQPRRTTLIEIGGEEDHIIGKMKQKTRYNIRLAAKKGVVVQQSDQVDAFSEIMGVTGDRDGFGVHNQAYFQKAYDLFAPSGMCALLMAEYEDQPIAGLFVFARGARAWYLYGASTNTHRNRMPTYLIQWEAIRWAKRQGCTQYDLWGVPDVEEEQLEANFNNRRDGLWGVYRFKRGFGGHIMRTAGAWDKVFNPLAYPAYMLATRKRGRE